MSENGEVIVAPQTRDALYLWHDGEATRIDDDIDTNEIWGVTSDQGHVAGRVETDSEPLNRLLPFLWTDGELTLQPTGDALVGHAFAVNDVGQVAGRLSGWPDEPSARQVVVWEDGAIVTPPSAPWGYAGFVVDINNRGQVLVSDTPSPNREGTTLWVWEVGGDVVEIEGIDELVDMNHRGMVLGHGTNAEGLERAYLWWGGDLTDLGTLGGEYVQAGALNEWGQVVGRSSDADGTRHHFLWYQGEMEQIDTTEALPIEAAPVAINNWGQVVSLKMRTFGSPAEVFLWQNDRSRNLGDVIAEDTGLTDAYTHADINDRGQILVVLPSVGGVMVTMSPTWGYYPDGS